MQLVIQPDGTIRCLYDEAIELFSLGSPAIQRGSHVEPDDAGRWHADLAPVGGPVLGPFQRRSVALAAEREWLERNWLNATYFVLDCSRIRYEGNSARWEPPALRKFDP